MYMPMSYGDPPGEYRKLTTGVSSWDIAAERRVEIVGPDAAALAQYVCALSLAEGLNARPLLPHAGAMLGPSR